MNPYSARPPSLTAAGFTLLELMIALLLLGVMMTLLFNGLRLGARTWDSVEERTRSAQDLQLAGLFLRRQIEQAQPLAFKDEQGEKRIPFSGERHAMRFVAPLPAHLGAGGMYWFTLGVAEGKDGKRLVLSYELFQREEWERYGAAEPGTAVLTQALNDAEFDYLGHETTTWASRWDQTDRLPRLIRLRVKFGDGPNGRWLELSVTPKLTASQPRA